MSVAIVNLDIQEIGIQTINISQYSKGAGENGIVFYIFDKEMQYSIPEYTSVRVEVILEKQYDIPTAIMTTTCLYETNSNKATMAISTKFTSNIGHYDAKLIIRNEYEDIDIQIPFIINIQGVN